MVYVTNKCMVSYDVTSLLTNIPLEETIHINNINNNNNTYK